MIVKSDAKDHSAWKIGVVKSLIKERDGVVPGAKLQVAGSEIERAVQQMYPMELACDVNTKTTETAKWNPDAPEFQPRTIRKAAEARYGIIAVVNQEDNNDDWC